MYFLAACVAGAFAGGGARDAAAAEDHFVMMAVVCFAAAGGLSGGTARLAPGVARLAAAVGTLRGDGRSSRGSDGDIILQVTVFYRRRQMPRPIGRGWDVIFDCILFPLWKMNRIFSICGVFDQSCC